jgi:hypothetical protein
MGYRTKLVQSNSTAAAWLLAELRRPVARAHSGGGSSGPLPRGCACSTHAANPGQHKAETAFCCLVSAEIHLPRCECPTRVDCGGRMGDLAPSSSPLVFFVLRKQVTCYFFSWQTISLLSFNGIATSRKQNGLIFPNELFRLDWKGEAEFYFPSKIPNGWALWD